MWMGLTNQLKAWIELKVIPPGCKRKFLLPNCLWAGITVFFFCLWTQTKAFALLESWACQALDWNYAISILGAPACWLQVLRLVSLHNCTSQFLIINLFIYLCTSFWFCFPGESWLIYSISVVLWILISLPNTTCDCSQIIALCSLSRVFSYN